MALLNFLDNVRGRVLDIKKIHSSISFSTPSDALASSLFIKYVDAAGVPLSLFDDLFTLFRHADFRADRVTLQRSEDILDRVANERRAIVFSRTLVQGQKTESDPANFVQTSTLIPELIAEFIDSQRVPFHRSIRRDRDYDNRPVGWEIDYMLKPMSLVQRSWTSSARRYLQRRINIIGQKRLRSLYQIPQIGPWVRELSFIGITSDSAYKHISTKEMPRLLCGIIEMCPNITHLYLEDFNLRPALGFLPSQFDKTSNDVIVHISGLKFLEHLGLLRAQLSDGGRQDLERLCAILPGFRSLKSLSLERWNLRENNAGRDETINILNLPHATCPPTTLDSVSLTNVNINSGILTWLTKSGGNGITKMRLCTSDIFIRRRDFWNIGQNQDLEYLRPYFKKGMENVVDLQLVGCPRSHEMLFLLRFFPSLRSFTIIIQGTLDGYLPSGTVVLPDSIQKLHLHFREVSEQDLGRLVQGILQSNPHLRQMTITYSSFRYHSDDSPSHLSFEVIIQYCVKNHVEFKVTKITDEVPHFLDL